jgi:hypothetical protein
VKITFKIEDEADCGYAIGRLLLLQDMFRVEADPDLQDKHDDVMRLHAVNAPHVELAADDTVEASQSRPGAQPQKVKRGKRADPVKILDVHHIATPPEDLRKAVVSRGLVFASMLVAQHGVAHIGELSDDQLRAALDVPA